MDQINVIHAIFDLCAGAAGPKFIPIDGVDAVSQDDVHQQLWERLAINCDRSVSWSPHQSRCVQIWSGVLSSKTADQGGDVLLSQFVLTETVRVKAISNGDSIRARTMCISATCRELPSGLGYRNNDVLTILVKRSLCVACSSPVKVA